MTNANGLNALPDALVSYVFLAEFNIDEGAVLKHQYPVEAGVDEHLLAEHMLPDGVHDRTEDWTIFYLNQIDPLSVKALKHRPQTSEDEPNGLLYVMSLVRTKKVATVRRGAMVKALAVASSSPFIQIFKPALLLALEDYFETSSASCLSKLFDSLNSLDMSAFPSLSRHEKLVLRTSDRKDLFLERFPGAEVAESEADYSEELADKVERVSISSRGSLLSAREDDASSVEDNSISFAPSSDLGNRSRKSSQKAGKGPKDTHFFETLISYNNLKLPIRIPVATFGEDVGDYSLINLIQTFSGPNALVAGPLHPHLHTNGAQTHPIVLLFNAMVTNKRVVFLGHQQPASKVADHVLAACALASGCGSVLKGFTERAFPYTNLTNLDNLQSVPGFIAGVCNPAFADRPSWWDVLLNIETGKVVVSKDIQMSAPPAPRTFNAATALKNVAPGESISAFSDDSDVSKSASPTDSNASQQQQQQSQQAKADRFESPDIAFIDEISTAIAAHYGEGVVRARFTDYVLRFVRLASRYEEEALGRSTIGWPSASYADGSLGSGMVFTDGHAGRELALNAGRIEGWRGSPSYRYMQDAWARSRGDTPFRSFDLLHQLSRLRHSRNIYPDEAEAIMRTLDEHLRTNDDVTALLAYLPPHFGGALPIAFGLFHASDVVRHYTLNVLEAIDSHPTGSRVLQNLNAFHKAAFVRLLAARQDANSSFSSQT